MRRPPANGNTLLWCGQGTPSTDLNGEHKTDLAIGANEPDLPSGTSTLRLGRRSDGKHVDPEPGKSPDGRESQFYGLIDDVAVFSKALTPAEMAAVVNTPTKRLTGTEPGLLAGWTFDTSKASGAPLPTKLTRPATFSSLPGAGGRASEPVTLSPSRNDAYDSALLPRPALRLKYRCPSHLAKCGA